MKTGKRILTTAVLVLATAAGICAEEADSTLRNHKLRPLEVMGIKQRPSGGVAVEAVTNISGAEARRLGIEGVKGIGVVTPNFFMPSYGSRMTSAIYVRGLGARMDQAVVGLSVDNIPYLNKDNYDFDVTDIQSIEVLRGAQAILNGRNTMGGQINILTLSPLTTKGLRASVQYGSGNTAAVSAGYYTTLAPKLGMSLSGQYRHTDGFFRNSYNNKRLDTENSGSVRWKTAWQPSTRLSLTNTAVLSLNRQGGYPYASLETGTIAYNDSCGYRRTAFADGLTVAWAGKRVVVTSVTSVQYLDDSMTLDQDFLPADYFTLTQSRRETSVTEDLFTRGSRGNYSWLGGAFVFYRHADIDAPVTFKDTGIAQLIEGHRNQFNPNYPIRWDSRNFTLGSNFSTNTTGFALYHESAYTAGKWCFEAGLRLDIEHASLSYHSFTNTGYNTMQRHPDGTETVYSHRDIDIDEYGSLDKTFAEVLPKVTVSYKGGALTPYITFSKGYKAGGYNTQMFSDVLQQRLMSEMGLTPLYKLDEIVSYEPERSFNYEAGIHGIFLADGSLKADAALFYISCTNQQLTTFPSGSTTGRIMTNAGRTRSFGAELSASWQATADLSARMSYGYTNATFRRYDDGRENYRGKRVPYAPAHTLFVEVHYSATPLTFCGLTPSVTVTGRGVGDIMWNEANTARQPFYFLGDASIGVQSGHWSVKLWGRNLTGTAYNTFYFKSIGNEFVQHGTPRQFGVTARLIL